MTEPSPFAPSLTPEQIARQAVEALRDGRLQPDKWALIDDLLLERKTQAAENILMTHRQDEPVYAGVMGGRRREKPN